MRGWMVGLIAAVLVVLAAGVAIVVALTATGDGTAIVDLEAGDCFDLPDDVAEADELVTVDVIDCETPHLAEVVSIGSLNTDGSPYPADDELFALVEAACRSAGVVESDAFGLLPIAPTQALWDSFDGRFVCVAIPYGGVAVTGSVVTG